MLIATSTYAAQCTMPNDATEMMKATSAEFRSAKNLDAAAFEDFRAHMNQRRAARLGRNTEKPLIH